MSKHKLGDSINFRCSALKSTMSLSFDKQLLIHMCQSCQSTKQLTGISKMKVHGT